MSGESKIELIVAADEPALFFSSVRNAETYLEANDVRDGVYGAAYGPDGLPFKLEMIADRVRISPVEGSALKSEELRALVVRYLSTTGLQDIEDAETLQSLLARCEGAAI